MLTIQFCSISQDLVSLNVGVTLPEYQYNSAQRQLTVQMTIRNTGYFNANSFDCALFLVSNTNSSLMYEVSRVNYSGLPYPSGNTLPITGWVVDLSNFAIPSGAYRLEARINDNQAAYESNYSNNIEYFGQNTFQYVAPSSAGLIENSESSIQLFPNPFLDLVNIKADHSIESVLLYNDDGRMIDILQLKDNCLNLSLLERGYYYLIIQDEYGNLIRKGLIKQ